jgi:general stress protein 26
MKTNLFSSDALKKLKGLLDEINICVFTTGNDKEYKNFSGVMPTTKVEEDGTIWFFTSKKSRKVNAVESNSAVHLMYAHPGKKNYIDV